MKIRNGFVSNSSSSSFVITAKAGKKATIEVDLNRLSREKASNDSELRSILLRDYARRGQTFEDLLADDDHARRLYVEGTAAFALGEVMYFGRLDGEDGDSIGSYLYHSGLRELEGVTIISGD